MNAFRVLTILVCVFTCRLSADEVNFYQENGQTIQEIRRYNERPIVRESVEQQQATVYRYKVKTESYETFRQVPHPVTTYQLQRYVHNWWRPFQPNYTTYHYVPRTVTQWRTEKIEVPVTYGQWEPETQLVERKVRTLEVEKTDEVVDRIVLGRPVSNPFAKLGQGVPVNATNPVWHAPNQGWVARSNGFGGIRQLYSDPPRVGTRANNFPTPGAIRR